MTIPTLSTNPCRTPIDDSSVTTGWSCPDPALPTLEFSGGFWNCTDGHLRSNPTYLNAKNPLTHLECWDNTMWMQAGIVAAELLILPGAWKLLVIPTVLFMGISGIH
jgi:hypothetical protein